MIVVDASVFIDLLFEYKKKLGRQDLRGDLSRAGLRQY